MATTVRKTQAPPDTSEWPLVLRLRPALDLTEDQFFEFCQLNRDLRIERSAEGEMVIMPPTGGETGRGNAEIIGQLWAWCRRDGTGVLFDSSTGFRLPNTAVRSPDASWMSNARYEAIPAAERQKFIPTYPDFVLELRSPSDALRDVQAKMQEYVAQGVRLAWLLDSRSRRVHVYRPNARVERLDNPQSVSGDPVLPGFLLDLQAIW